MSREERLAQLANLNEALRRQGVEPVFAEDIAAGLSHRGLKAAIRLAEAELVSATQKLAEQ